jgi:carboxypeptidase family protein
MRPNFMVSGLLCAALILSAVSAPAVPQTVGLGTVGGQILGPDGKVIGGARVTLQASDGRSPQTTETNTQGRFWFPMLPAGPYDVRAYSQGQWSEWRKNVPVDVGRQTTITLRLRPQKHAPGKFPPSLARP